MNLGVCYKILTVLFVLISPLSIAVAQSGVPYTVDIFATVPGCGDATMQAGEQCDGLNLGGASCNSLGFDSGTIECSSVCTIITSNCTFRDPSSNQSSQQRSDMPSVPKTNVVISGLSAPGSVVSLLSAGQLVGTAVTANDGRFQITVSGFTAGIHVMQLVATSDFSAIVRSATFEVRVVQDLTTRISRIVLPPAILATVYEEDVLTLNGRAVPGSVIQIYFANQSVYTGAVSAEGTFSIAVPILPSRPNEQFITADVLIDGIVSARTYLTSPRVIPTPSSPPQSCSVPFDTNQDCRMNISDFMFLRDAQVSRAFPVTFDFDQSGTIDIVDFSILAFYWTG